MPAKSNQTSEYASLFLLKQKHIPMDLDVFSKLI